MTIIICTQCTCAIQGKGVVDATSEGILDSFKTKTMALELAMEAALTILRVDQVIVQFVSSFARHFIRFLVVVATVHVLYISLLLLLHIVCMYV